MEHEAWEDMPIGIVMGATMTKTSLGALFEENEGLFDDAGQVIISALQQYGEYRGGGGATGEYTLTRRPA